MTQKPKRSNPTCKTIKDFPEYHVYYDGVVWSEKSLSILKMTEHNGKQPYYYVTLSNKKTQRKFLVHRLVAEAFIPNPNGYEQVNHIDGNVHNNHYRNLEWCTNAENTQHAYDTNLNKLGHCICKVTNQSGMIQEFTSFRKAEQVLGIGSGVLSYHHTRKGSTFKVQGYEIEVMSNVQDKVNATSNGSHAANS